jgi:hypothetical protein
MQQPKGFWRSLFFILLITALCGGLALPMVSAPVRAAPQMQATACTGTTITQWDFTGDVVTPSFGSGTFSVGSALPAPSFAGGNPGRAVTFDTWTSGLDDNKYVNLLVPTSGRTSIGIAFDYRSTGSGPTTIELRYSTNGVNFIPYNSQTLNNDSNFHNLVFDLSPIPEVSNHANANFRLYAYGASNTNGTLRLDNITFTGACLTPAELTATVAANLTSTSIALSNTVTSTSTPTDTGTPTVTGTATNTATPTSTGTVTRTPTATNTPATGSAANVVISEFRTRGPDGASDEFVEIYNPTSNAVDISGWTLSASNSSGTVQERATVPAGILLRSGQYYLFAHNSYTTSTTPSSPSPNVRYGTSISDDGGIALLDEHDQIVDEVGMSQGSTYQEGTPLPPLTGTTHQSYERLNGGASDSCVDTDDNSSDFQDANSGSIHNYGSPLSLCGTPRPAPSTSTTVITGDSPDPSVINGNVSVSVRVTGGATTPTGRVYISGANTNCIITLNASGTGSCTVKFTSNGTKILSAAYTGDNTHASSFDTETHQVGTTTVRTPTRIPTLRPPPPLIAINEFVPRPGHDWNADGVVNVGDEFIELINHGVIDVNLSGYTLDDEVNIGSTPFRLPSVTMRPGERRVFYGSETQLLLSDGGDGVRLIMPNGQLGDAFNYRVVRFPDQSYCRLPDNGGLDDWNNNCFPTPGLQNSISGSNINPPTSGDVDNLCPIADTLPNDFVLAECPPFGIDIWNPAYWDRDGWYNERFLPESPGKWNVFVD